jgi:peroxiredoxin
MQSLRDAANELAKLNAVILGISVDTAQTQKEFCAEQKLPFPLLADPEGKIAKSFGVFNEGGNWQGASLSSLTRRASSEPLTRKSMSARMGKTSSSG